MTQRLFAAVLTVVVFLGGYATRVWTERGQPVPPPPAAIERELALAPKSDAKADPKAKREIDRAKLLADIQKLRPQIEAYVTQVQEIETEFDREFNAILNPKQREKRAGNLKKHVEDDAKRIANREPLSDEAIARERERPLTDIYWMITITPRLERVTKEYELDTAQQNSARALLSLRRNKFIALFDATPHPSIRLSRLAPVIERVGAPAK